MVREEERTVIKKRCMNLISSDTFEEFSPVDDLGSFGDSWDEFLSDSCGFSDCVPVVSSGVLVVTDAFVSLPSVGVFGEVIPSGSDCEIVKPQSSSFSRKRRALHMESQGDTNSTSSAEDVQQLSRGMTQEVDCEFSKKSWAAVYQSIARRMLGYLDNSEALKVDTKELEEHVLAPNEPSVDMEHIVRQARGEKHKKMFQIFSRQGTKRDPGRQCGEIGSI